MRCSFSRHWFLTDAYVCMCGLSTDTADSVRNVCGLFVVAM